MKKLLVPFLLFCCLLLSACGKVTADDPFSYVNATMTLTVRGEVSMMPSPDKAQQGSGAFSGITRADEPLEFSGTVRTEPLPKGQVSDGTLAAENRWRVSITYTSPDALAGMSVACVLGADGTASDATLTYPAPHGTVTLSLPYASARGLLRPALCLLPQGDVTSVSPTKDGVRSVTVTATDAGRETIFSFGQDSPYPVRIDVADPHGQMHLYLNETP